MAVDLSLIKKFSVSEEKEKLSEFEKKRAEREIEKIKDLANKYKQ